MGAQPARGGWGSVSYPAPTNEKPCDHCGVKGQHVYAFSPHLVLCMWCRSQQLVGRPPANTLNGQ